MERVATGRASGVKLCSKLENGPGAREEDTEDREIWKTYLPQRPHIKWEKLEEEKYDFQWLPRPRGKPRVILQKRFLDVDKSLHIVYVSKRALSIGYMVQFDCTQFTAKTDL